MARRGVVQREILKPEAKTGCIENVLKQNIIARVLRLEPAYLAPCPSFRGLWSVADFTLAVILASKIGLIRVINS